MPWKRAWQESRPNCAQRTYTVGSGGWRLSGFQKPPMSWLHMLIPDRLRLNPDRSAAAMPPQVVGWSPVHLIGYLCDPAYPERLNSIASPRSSRITSYTQRL